MVTYPECQETTGKLLNIVADLADAALMNKTLNLKDEIESAVQVEVGRIVEGLKAKKDELGKQCRALKDELAGIVRDQYIWEQGEVGLINATGRLSMQHRLASLEKPKITDFPTQAELLAWEQKVATALTALQTKGSELAEHQRDYALWKADIANRQEALAKLTAEYADLHKRINAMLGIAEEDNAGNSVSFVMK